MRLRAFNSPAVPDVRLALSQHVCARGHLHLIRGLLRAARRVLQLPGEAAASDRRSPAASSDCPRAIPRSCRCPCLQCPHGRHHQHQSTRNLFDTLPHSFLPQFNSIEPAHCAARICTPETVGIPEKSNKRRTVRPCHSDRGPSACTRKTPRFCLILFPNEKVSG